MDELTRVAHVDSPVHHQQRMGIIVRCTEDIEAKLSVLTQTINENSKSADNLGNKVFWLNVVLAIATAIGTIVSVIDLVRKLNGGT